MKPSWPLAFALSLSLHGLAAAALWRWPVSTPCRTDREPCEVSVISVEPDSEECQAGADSTLVMPMTFPAPIVSQPDDGPKLPPVNYQPAVPDKPAPDKPAPGNPSGNAAGPAGQGAEPSGRGTGHGAATTTTFFQVPARGQTIVYLIDVSASMGPSGALEEARQELLASIRRLPPQVRFQIIVFHSQAHCLLPGSSGWLAAGPETLGRVETALRDVRAEGKTEYDQALKWGLAMKPDVLFLLTDGRDLPVHLVQEATRMNDGRSVIHAIELSNGVRPAEEGALQHLARQNRGAFQLVVLRDRSDQR